MARIAIGGFQHETNTFAPSRADYAQFEAGGGWPGACYGERIFPALEGANIPAQGAVEALAAAGHRLIGTAWAAASPSAHVTREAFERIAGELIARLKAALPVDGVYLDLHGAMVAEHCDDGEGEILRRVREVIGERVPLVASLDLHGNVTRAMVARADALVGYRTYPHVDMAATGARAARLLAAMLADGARPARAYATLDFLTGISSQCTFIEPCRSLFAELEALERASGATLSFMPGFPMADFEECGMTVFGYGPERAAVDAAVARLRAAVAQAEPEFAMQLYSPEEAVARALARGEPGRPVVIADTQDNPGAGGNGDTTGMLAALVRARASGAVLGLLIDAEVARRAHEAGEGATLALALGGRSRVPGDSPFQGEFTVERLADGRFTCTGPMFKGFRMQLGPMALLRCRAAPGVRVALASRKVQAADKEMFRHVGVEPVRERILVLKSSVHFRADFEPIAKEVLVARAPGPALADPAEFPWKRLRKGLRLRPLGPAFGG
jgi:microcystin degradation protein MlrC